MNRSQVLRLARCLLLGFAAGAWAAPAPWYLWKSAVDGSTFCSQTPPGNDWFRFKGPFDNGRCVKREPGDGDGLIRKPR